MPNKQQEGISAPQYTLTQVLVEGETWKGWQPVVTSVRKMDDDIQCPACYRWFAVIWNNDGKGPPEYCPMCGSEIDYAKAARLDKPA